VGSKAASAAVQLRHLLGIAALQGIVPTLKKPLNLLLADQGTAAWLIARESLLSRDSSSFTSSRINPLLVKRGCPSKRVAVR